MSPQAFLKESRELVNAALDTWLPPADTDPRRLHEAMRYSIFAGGKRLRPAIARAACLAVGGGDEDALPVACALEMLHTYSLIHDDLPVIDNDDLRRGRPTCHVRFGDATAILAGDALQTQAFWVLAEKTPRREAVAALVVELAHAAGTQGMVGGEIADIEAEGAEPRRSVVEFIHERKTAALFSASAAMGAMAAGADGVRLTALRTYGVALGLAFQIVDDILDETSGKEQLGKTPGKDRASGKMSYPAAVGLEASREWALEFSRQAKAALAAVGEPDILVALVDFAVSRAH